MTVVRRVLCVVDQIRDHTEHVYTVRLTPRSPVPRFRPGQFLHLALDDHDQGGFWPESRVFSIASSPTERDHLEITYAVKGDFTGRMERELRRGRNVWVKLPYGDFMVDGRTDVVLCAGGTGITAFAGFLGSLTPDHQAQVVLLYGSRLPQLFVYRALVSKCERRVAKLTCRLVCEETDGLLDLEAAWPLIAGLQDPCFYLSGPAAMLTALDAQASARGVRSDRIKIDAW